MTEMSSVRATLIDFYRYLTPWGVLCYRQPLLMGVILSLLSSYYLIVDFAVVNQSSLSLLWALHQSSNEPTFFGQLIKQTGSLFNISFIDAGHVLMVLSHALLMGLLLSIAKQLYFAKTSRWALILLMLSNPSYNDFRTYIIVEPLFWCCWLLAIYVLLLYYRQHTLFAIAVWFCSFLFATQFVVAAWFWLLLFPFGALFWKPWRRKSVAYALLGYAVIVIVLLFLPVYQGDTPLRWLITTIVENPDNLSEVFGLNQSNWIQEENLLMVGVFVFSGATSLVIIRTLIAFGLACVGLAVYAVLRKQYTIVDGDRLRILLYVVVFDLFISVVLFVIDKNHVSLASFSVSLLLFLLAALGLSYLFKKMLNGRYSRLTVLVIVWCLVAYIASGFIIFGPRKGYLREAGTVALRYNDLPLYSGDELFLFYARQDPERTTTWENIQVAVGDYAFYYAYGKNRNRKLPDSLQLYTPIERFANRRGDSLLIYRFTPTGIATHDSNGNNNSNDTAISNIR